MKIVTRQPTTVLPDTVSSAADEPWNSVIVFVPVRLGADKLNMDYVSSFLEGKLLDKLRRAAVQIPSLLECMKFPQSLGFMVPTIVDCNTQSDGKYRVRVYRIL